MSKLDGSVALALIFCSTTALAQEPDTALLEDSAALDEQPRTLHLQPVEPDRPQQEARPTLRPKASQAASDGLLSPFTSGAAISTSRAFAQSYVGYDGAASETRARVAAEGRLTNFLALRVEFEHGPATGTENRLSVGARFGILTQQKYGIDLGAGIFYQPKDFRDEGNVVAGLLLARHFGHLGLFANTLLGSDPEGDDQSLELRLGSLYAANDWLSVGVDATFTLELLGRCKTRSSAQHRLGNAGCANGHPVLGLVLADGAHGPEPRADHAARGLRIPGHVHARGPFGHGRRGRRILKGSNADSRLPAGTRRRRLGRLRSCSVTINPFLDP